jgi:hypothetical protein
MRDRLLAMHAAELAAASPYRACNPHDLVRSVVVPPPTVQKMIVIIEFRGLG